MTSKWEWFRLTWYLCNNVSKVLNYNVTSKRESWGSYAICSNCHNHVTPKIKLGETKVVRTYDLTLVLQVCDLRLHGHHWIQLNYMRTPNPWKSVPKSIARQIPESNLRRRGADCQGSAEYKTVPGSYNTTHALERPGPRLWLRHENGLDWPDICATTSQKSSIIMWLPKDNGGINILFNGFFPNDYCSY